MKKLITSSKESRDKIKSALRLITEPVVQTLSPLGLNVLYEDSNGQLNLTNDGVTIAKQIESDDPIENAIVSIVKHGALKTNQIAGDGTTTTTLYTDLLVREGLKKIEDGMNPMVLKEWYETLAETFIGGITPTTIDNDTQLLHIATISANNDEEIAVNVVDIVNTAGEDGTVLIEQSVDHNTIVEKNSGFIIEGGIFSPEYAQDGGFNTKFDECHVLVTDKRLYYEEEAATILRLAIENGVDKLVIVARDFIGKSVNVFAHNQANNPMIELLLIKDNNCKETDNTSLKDLSIYLDGPLVTEKQGKIVDNLTIEDFCLAKRVYANPHRAVISAVNEPSKELQNRIESLRNKKDEDPDNDDVGRRLASLTSGMVTVKVGGATPIELREKIFRYEDAINAARAANKYGYLPGGGIAIMSAFVPGNFPEEIRGIAQKLSEATVRQIAKNSGLHEESILAGCKPVEGIGFNAKTEKFEDMVSAGVIDPYQVTEMAIKNSVSIANTILTAGWLVVLDKEKDNDK